MDEFFGFLFVLAVLVGVFLGIAQAVESSDHDNCHERGELANVKVTYRKWDGCYVNQNGLWMPYDIWKYNRDHGIIAK